MSLRLASNIDRGSYAEVYLRPGWARDLNVAWSLFLGLRRNTMSTEERERERQGETERSGFEVVCLCLGPWSLTL